MPRTDAAAIVDTLTAYWRSAALAAALELDLFTALGNESLSPVHLAARCGGRADAVATLCRSLAAQGLLASRDGRFRAPRAVARLLDARSPQAIGDAYRFFNSAALTHAFWRLADTVRGSTARPRRVPGPQAWARFAAATWALRRTALRGVATTLAARHRLGRRLLDVGAGASPMGVHLLGCLPDAHLTVIDHPLVIDASRPLWRAAGLDGRITPRRADARTSRWGGPFDAVLMVNVLEHVPAKSHGHLLRKARAALAPGGLLVICSPLFDTDRVGPRDAVDYDLLLLAMHAPSRAASVGEMRSAILSAGFARAWRVRGLPLMLGRS